MKSLFISLSLTTLAGGVYALSYPSFIGQGWFPLILIAFPFFMWKLEDENHLKTKALHILSFNVGLNLIGYYWIPHTLREFGQLPYYQSVVAGLLFSFILQPHWWLYLLWEKYRPRANWNSELGILVTAFVLTILERYFPQQFPSYAGSPWLHLSPYLGLAPYFGVAIFSFFTYWVALEVCAQIKFKKIRPQVWIIFIVFVILNAAMPLKKSNSNNTINVRITQANIGNFLKIQSELGDENSFQSVREAYKNLSIIKNNFTPDLIIWPETAYPDSFSGKKNLIDSMFLDIMKLTGAEMLIGGYHENLNKSPFDFYENVYNSSILLSEGQLKSAYHKNILIPFGETLPFGDLNSQIVSVIPAVSLFARGEGTPLMETRDHYRFVTPICYEILESNFMRKILNQWGNNHFIVNHTNDSWYGETAEPFQHLFLSKWRALEFNLPIIRSTNTGITSVIYPDGSESKRLQLGEVNNLDVAVNLGSGEETIYQRYGVYSLCALFLILFFLTWIKNVFIYKIQR